MATLKVIKREELEKHKTKTSLWIVVHGYVFDVTQWKERHPGGWELLWQINQDGEDGGKQFEEIKHSTDARMEAMNNLIIGRLEDAPEVFPMKPEGKLHPTPDEPYTPTDIPENNKVLYIGIGIVAVAAAYLIYQRKKVA